LCASACPLSQVPLLQRDNQGTWKAITLIDTTSTFTPSQSIYHKSPICSPSPSKLISKGTYRPSLKRPNNLTNIFSVTDLQPNDTEEEPFHYTFKVQCTSCREVHPNWVTVNRHVREHIAFGSQISTLPQYTNATFSGNERAAGQPRRGQLRLEMPELQGKSKASLVYDLVLK
jgi:hypothetical protein